MQIDLYQLLEEKFQQFNTPDFIEDDPISIPHQFTLKQDIEIMGLFASVLAWGQRKTIINKCNELVQIFDSEPFEFILNHSENDLKALEKFVHRTFNSTDLLYFISFLNHHYKSNESLETAFLSETFATDENIGNGLNAFKKRFFSLEYAPKRTQKHISSPLQKSACKRLSMYLRWMIRNDNAGVDFGIWTNLKPSQLICPCDVHVERVARKLNLLQSEKLNWNSAVELTNNLKEFDKNDPVKYDFALFGMGIEKYFA